MAFAVNIVNENGDVLEHMTVVNTYKEVEKDEGGRPLRDVYADANGHQSLEIDEVTKPPSWLKDGDVTKVLKKADESQLAKNLKVAVRRHEKIADRRTESAVVRTGLAFMVEEF